MILILFKVNAHNFNKATAVSYVFTTDIIRHGEVIKDMYDDVKKSFSF